MDRSERNPLVGIGLKVASVVIFVAMSTLIKAAGTGIPTGQITFYRSAFAMIPILAYLALRGALRQAFQTQNLPGHLSRGFIGILAMSCGFYGLTHLPLPEAIAIGYAMPLIAVIFAAVFLKEVVRAYRWSAVAIGLIGVAIITWPRLTLFGAEGADTGAAMGAIAVLASASLGATAMVLVRKLVDHERTHTIVLYFSLSASCFSLLSLPFGWEPLTGRAFVFLMLAGFCGGVAQLLMTESYRHADMSVIAPFEYTSIVLGLAIGYLVFGDVPTIEMLAGTLIVIGAGIFIIVREHRLGLERKGARRHVTPQG
ncbi:DMT family transporter [Rhizobium sp. YIM 134829]|uniref:DMT family transporter n=1 Tax=Rhizobium sp. YIM 134829 TaxID=3390453 RepID=UPI0039794BE8